MFIEQRNIAISELDLDPENPRLPSYVERTPQEILRFLAASSAIDELISAIGSNGYFSSEPLIAVPSGARYVVIEGNRRLTALKLLNGEDIGEVSQKIQTALDRAIYNPDAVMVALYTERDDILNYLGNKHIAGVKPWGALAKARYSRQLFEKVNTDGNYSEKIREVARAIGSRTDFISRALKALTAYEIAENNDFFELEGVNERSVKFSLLSTALDYEGIQEFVYDNPDEEQENRTINEDALKDLFSWMFEIHEEGKTRLGESRNLVQLSRVVANEVGLANFRRGLPLSQAYILSDGIDDEFDSIATKIQGGLRDANSIIAEVSYSEERANTVRSISKQARQLRTAFENDED